MKTELKAKFLQHLNQKKSEKGFTLIELLVVIIIIGILAAIALPTFLNQTAKGKQSEGKQNVSTTNKLQTAYRTENSSFATSFSLLASGTLNGDSTATLNNYTYTLAGYTDSTTVYSQSVDTALKSYSGGVKRYNNTANQPVMVSILCEYQVPGTTAATVPNLNTGTVAPTCATEHTEVKP